MPLAEKPPDMRLSGLAESIQRFMCVQHSRAAAQQMFPPQTAIYLAGSEAPAFPHACMHHMSS
jgi:hypothetical protein